MLVALTVLTAAGAEQPRKATPESLERWRAMRFGMFIHWGPISLKATEISWSRANSNPQCPNNGPIPVAEYDNLYTRFNPTNFNAKEWVAIAKAAGMKYMILTAKHCDGFLLWNSKVSDYTITHTPFKRDVCAELAKAAHEAGMAIGWYYSPMDWRDPDCRGTNNAAFVQRMHREIVELLTNYGKIDLLWFDTDGRSVPWDQETIYPLIRKLQPGIVIDNRLDSADPLFVGPWADYYTPEQYVGGFNAAQPWESCMTISRSGQWSWGGPDDGVKPFEACMDMLLRCAGGDGNMLLNVGPTPTGAIAPEQANRLKDMGTWLAKYGDAIYGTRGGPFKPGTWGVSTHKDNRIFLFVMQWPVSGIVQLPAITPRITGVKTLTGGEAHVAQTGKDITVALPEASRDKLATVIELTIDGRASDIAPMNVYPNGAPITVKSAAASNVYQNNPEYAADKATDGDTQTRWACDTGTTSAWLEVDLGAPATIGRARICEGWDRARRFALEQYADGKWLAFAQGTTIGAAFETNFPPVTAQRIRLNVIEATDGPTIGEFELFPPASALHQ